MSVSRSGTSESVNNHIARQVPLSQSIGQSAGQLPGRKSTISQPVSRQSVSQSVAGPLVSNSLFRQ